MIIFFLFRPDHGLSPRTALFRFFAPAAITLHDHGFLHKHNPGCFPRHEHVYSFVRCLVLTLIVQNLAASSGFRSVMPVISEKII
jgi:hypothetical protein